MATSNFRKTCIRLLIVSASILLAGYFAIILFKDAFVDFVMLELPTNLVLGSLATVIITCVVTILLLMVNPNKSQAQTIEVK